MTTAALQTNSPIKRQNKALSYFKIRLGALKPLIITNSILGLFSYVLFGIGLANYTNSASDYYGNAEEYALMFFAIICCMSLGGMFIVSYVTGIWSFNFYHNRNVSDMSLSLPLNHKERFWGNFLSGVAAISIPYIISAALGTFIAVTFSKQSVLNKIFEDEPAFNGLNGFLIKFVFPILLTGLIVLLTSYIFTVFCASVCGNAFMTMFYPILLSVVTPLLIVAFNYLSIRDVRGFEANPNPFLLSVTSPLGLLYATFFRISELDIASGVLIAQPICFIPLILINAGVIAASYYLLKRAKAENIGTSFLHKLTYHVQQSVVCLCITVLFIIAHLDDDSGAYIGWLIVISAVVFLIGDLIYNGGIKGLKKAAVKYGITLAGSILICLFFYLGSLTNGFGSANYVPKASDIKKVEISYFFHADNDGQEYAYTLNKETFPLLTLKRETDFYSAISPEDYSKEEWKEITSEVVKFHRAILENPRAGISAVVKSGEEPQSYGYNYNLYVRYELKGGLIVERRYANANLPELLEKGVFEYVSTSDDKGQYYY